MCQVKIAEERRNPESPRRSIMRFYTVRREKVYRKTFVKHNHEILLCRGLCLENTTFVSKEILSNAALTQTLVQNQTRIERVFKRLRPYTPQEIFITRAVSNCCCCPQIVENSKKCNRPLIRVHM
jgi:hypothetical protein